MGAVPTDPTTEGTRGSASGTKGVRIHFLDWLRALAVLGVFLYHSLRPFTTDQWHVTSSHPSAAADGLIGFVDPWGIAFFFLIAGASAFLALGWRSAGQYVRERLLRLALPLVIAYLLLSPIQAYVEETHFGRYAGTFVAAVPLFFRDVGSRLPTTLPHPLLVADPYHLWFVIFLLWYALLGLPVFLWLRARQGRQLSTWLGDRAAGRGSTLLLALPISILPLAVLPAWPESEDWGTFAYLFGFFVLGAVLMSEPRLADAVRRDVRVSLVAALVVDVAMLLTGVPAFIDAWGSRPSYSPMYVWSYLAVTVQAWAWVSTFLGWGARAKRFRGPLPRMVSEAAMPFFIVHQPVILAVAFSVVRWGVPMLVEWMIIATCSFLVSAALAVALSRVPVVSAGFGVKRALAHDRQHPARLNRSTLGRSP